MWSDSHRFQSAAGVYPPFLGGSGGEIAEPPAGAEVLRWRFHGATAHQHREAWAWGVSKLSRSLHLSVFGSGYGDCKLFLQSARILGAMCFPRSLIKVSAIAITSMAVLC